MATNNPYVIEQQQQQQQGMGGMNPMGMVQMFQGGGQGGLTGLFGGGGASTATTATAGATGATTAATGGAAAGGSAAGGASGAGASALASNPVGWIIAAALAQNVAHNKGISSWGDALKGTSGRKAGDHFLDQWGVSDDSTGGKAVRGLAGIAGWGSGGGVLNPSYINEKIFG